MLRLMNIQQKLKAPKNQRNNFGNYNYRSAEDILEAVKPILKEERCVIIIGDEVVSIGDRIYIKATARLIGADDGKEISSVSAFARESEDKKGQDDSQITGATSSYARKYALNGLFAIDDNKDADATNTHGKEPLPEDLNKISTFLSQQEDPKQYYWDIKNHKELDENTKRKIINAIIYPKN